MAKRFALPPKEQIRRLIPPIGSCITTDRVTVDGAKVGYMHRDTPRNELDSGWRFFAGDESQEFLDNPANSGLYDVNTIANHDPEIIPFLQSPFGSAFIRNPLSGRFEPSELPEDPDLV